MASVEIIQDQPMTAPNRKKPSRTSKDDRPRPDLVASSDDHYWRNQLRGLLAGAVIGFMLTILFPALADRFTTLRVVFWSAIAGGVLWDLDGFRRGGQAITHRTDRRLNLVVGLGVPLIVLSIIWLLIAWWSGALLGS
jgi:hypothetical protein